MNQHITRRNFLKSAGSAVVGASLLNNISRTSCGSIVRVPNSRLQVAAVGVGGMMGFNTLNSVAAHSMVDVIALCDVDTNYLNRAAASYPKARKYADWRDMLTHEEKFIDALAVATPDHMHAPISISAIHLGKHVYCQKPMTHDVFEARQVTRAAHKAGVVTQLGNQHASGIGDRMAVQMIRDGAIGKIKEVYMWSNRSNIGEYRRPGPRPSVVSPVPASLQWDLWLGTAPERPYNASEYHPSRWRAWQDFGTGWGGDLGCHIGSAVFLALGLTAPTTVRAEVEPAWIANPARHYETWPLWQIISYEYPGTSFTADKTLKATWLDGGNYPSKEVHALFENHGWPEECAIFIGENGHLMLPHGSGPLLFPVEKYKDYKRPKLPGIDHYQAWVDACLSGQPQLPISNFDLAGPLTEAVLLGTVAARRSGQTLQWDTARLKITNDSASSHLLRRRYRDGWAVPGL